MPLEQGTDCLTPMKRSGIGGVSGPSERGIWPSVK
jgi:hypothetical protein